MFTDGLQARHMGAALEFFAQGFRQIAHLVEIARTALVDPAKQLRGPEALLAQPLAKGGHGIQVKVQKVRGHNVYRMSTPT